MSEIKVVRHQRNREIGQVLEQTRREQGRSISECAAQIATSRRRYRAIEAGEIGLEVTELEMLVSYLQIPANRVWNIGADVASLAQGSISLGGQKKVLVQARPGEQIQVVLEVQR